MSRRDYLPEADGAFAFWVTAFTAHVASDHARYGLDESDAADLEAAHADYFSARAVVADPATRTRPSVAARNDCRGALERRVRSLVHRIQAFPGVSDTDRADLGIALRNAPRARRIDAPVLRPVLSWMAVYNRNTQPHLQIADPTATTRLALPPGVASALVFTVTCPADQSPPRDVRQWRFECVATRSIVPAPPPAATPTPPGHHLYLTAVYTSPRGELGPPAAPLRLTDPAYAAPAFPTAIAA